VYAVTVACAYVYVCMCVCARESFRKRPSHPHMALQCVAAPYLTVATHCIATHCNAVCCSPILAGLLAYKKRRSLRHIFKTPLSSSSHWYHTNQFLCGVSLLNVAFFFCLKHFFGVLFKQISVAHHKSAPFANNHKIYMFRFI